MRALSFSSFGGPGVLEVIEAERPDPAAGQVRVRVSAAGVNPYDLKVRQGQFGGALPKRVGIEFAGIVDVLGEGVDDVAVGDAVYGLAIGGGAAEFTRSAHYAPVPPGLDPVSAAALPVAVETAYRLLDGLNVSAGQTLLVNGASGAVGQTIVQIAAARRARVIGTASAANLDRVRDLDAEAIVHGSGLAERVRALGVDELDAAIDAGGGGVLPDLVELTGSADRVVTIVDADGAEATGVAFSGQNSAFYGLTAITELIQAGRFSLPVAQVYDLADAAAAHTRLEAGGVRGKLVLKVA